MYVFDIFYCTTCMNKDDDDDDDYNRVDIADIHGG